MSECTRIEPLLYGDYLDGALGIGERADVEAHLDDCSRCRDTLADLRRLGIQTAALPREISPPTDLWAGIERRIGSGTPATMEPAADGVIPLRTSYRRPRLLRPAWLAAAAVALVVVSSATTAYLVTPGGSDAMPSMPAVAAAGPSLATLASMQPLEREYLGTVELLASELDRRRPELSATTIAVIEQNLRIIDDAIASSRAALEADPSSTDLPLMLSDMYRRKVELLQYAVDLPAET